MNRLLSIAVLVASVTLVSRSALVGQDDPKDDRPAKVATPEDYKRLAALSPPTYRGKVSVTPKGVAFRIDDSEYRRQLKYAATQGKPAEQKAAIAAVERQFASVKWALGKEFLLELSEKVVLRKTRFEFEYDDKGNPKKMPAAEGGTYPAKIEDFGDYPTTVTFGKMKDGKPTAARLVVDNSKGN